VGFFIVDSKKVGDQSWDLGPEAGGGGHPERGRGMIVFFWVTKGRALKQGVTRKQITNVVL